MEQIGKVHKVTVFGAGHIGHAIAVLLSNSLRYTVVLADHNLDSAHATAKVCPPGWVIPRQSSANDETSVAEALTGSEAVISALPFYCNTTIARIARGLGVHYFDLTEDITVTEEIRRICEGSESVFMPQCGLAPGFISVAASSLMNGIENVVTIKMRVGALPRFPTNRLKYNLTWSTVGLINEYIRPCDAIVDGIPTKVPPLEGYERVTIDGQEYEAFNTSGGLGSLCRTLERSVQYLSYKSLRYPGHRDLVLFLLEDLRLREKPKELATLLDCAIPRATKDVCLTLVEVTGYSGEPNKCLLQHVDSRRIINSVVYGVPLSAIQLTTAAGVCVPLDLLLSGQLPNCRGFTAVERISLKTFLNNSFSFPFQGAEKTSHQPGSPEHLNVDTD